MLKRIGNGLIYDDFNDNLGALIGGIIGERIVDVNAKGLAKEKQAQADQASADKWNADNSVALADSAYGMKMDMSGIDTPNFAVGDYGELDTSSIETPSYDFRKPVDTSGFMSKLSGNLTNPDSFDFNRNVVSRDMFLNRNRNRLPNAFSKLS